MEAIGNHEEGDQLKNQAASSNSNNNNATESAPISSELEGVLSDTSLSGFQRLRRATVIELNILFKLAAPAIVVYLLNDVTSMATQIFCGHLGNLELAAASLGNNGIQIFAYGVMFLQAQSIVAPNAIISAVTLVVHILATWVVVYYLGWGLLGASLVLSFSWWIVVVAQFVYILTSSRCKYMWTGFSVQAFSGLWSFLKLSTASGVMLCLETWYYQILVLIAGLLENPEIASDALSVCVRVSNELGAKHPKSAAFSVVIVTLCSLVIAMILAAVVPVLRHIISYVFTGGETVAGAVSELAPYLAVAIILNGVQPVLSETKKRPMFTFLKNKEKTTVHFFKQLHQRLRHSVSAVVDDDSYFATSIVLHYYPVVYDSVFVVAVEFVGDIDRDCGGTAGGRETVGGHMYFRRGVAVGCGWQTFVAYVNVGCYYVVGIPLGSLLGFYFNLGAKVEKASDRLDKWKDKEEEKPVLAS
ncbi:hypothetical protein Vadar_033091 [Vaccinium darrowii]|uniref:Uncharacterized protein n=1 Tax=Vaccinium darrowii TaxID=229202 RepID=A0ACB7XDY3_9ERIC|nr:hypothetical protein Vadar_033091 [Vaccinium darrowii]